MWRNWNPLNPPINDQSSDDYESPPENNPGANELVSPSRPHQSASASPRALLRPDPPPVEEVLGQVNQRLRNLPTREQRVANRNAHREAQEAAEQAAAAARAAAMPPAVVNFEDENGADDASALQNACRNLERFTWDQNDIKFTFQKLEIKMSAVGVKKQYTKFQVLATVIPKLVEDEVKSMLTKQEAEFPENNAYKKLKQRILKIFGPKPEDSISRALNRVLTGLPSQLARALVNDICKHEFDCQCCPDMVLTLWKRQLPGNVRAGIAHCVFNKDTFDEVTELADKIYTSNRPNATIAAITSGSGSQQSRGTNNFVSTSPLDETQPGLDYPVPEVNAVSRGGRGGRGWRGGRGRGNGRGGQNQPQTQNQNQTQSTGPKHKGTKHPDLPAGEWKGCRMHFRHGRGAYFCAEPTTCPWKNVYAPKPQQ